MGSAVRSVTRLVTKPLQAIGILPKAPKAPSFPTQLTPKAPTAAAPETGAQIADSQAKIKKSYAMKKGRRSTIMTSPQGLQSEEEITKKKLLGTER